MAQFHKPEPLPERDLIDWIRDHSSLEKLCAAGGWPDVEHAEIEVCSRSEQEWIVNISTTESVMEISECNVSEYSRCGKYAVSLDLSGHPTNIDLLYPM